jgi:(E)-2-((N-methylformamido)methylene)succinate hydrolase
VTPTMSDRSVAGDTAYIDKGQGETIIFIHGVGLNADAWGPQIAAFSKTHRVIAIDMLGHGGSGGAPEGVTLDHYVQQVADVMAALGINTANIVGHSMGGLVAIGFALAHPGQTLRLAVLNSVYQRTDEKRAAVMARAAEIATSGTVGDIEAPLERWFGPRAEQTGIAHDVRRWLSQVSPKGYATAYQVFAASDSVFAGKLGALKMPCLFATGSDDPNSTPEMANAMARETRRGRSLVLAGERHMMNLTNPEAINVALQDLFREQVIDVKDLRKAFGTFMTGVTVVTTRDNDGQLRGFTANSFSSVSLDPPLLLVCISKAAASCDAFAKGPGFAVNILSEGQKDVSGSFASKRADKFADVNWRASPLGHPLLEGSVAWFDCANHKVVDAGDHLILIGEVKSYGHNDSSPLGYARGGYFTLGLEQSAVNAASQAGRAEVGAILECDNKLLVFPSGDKLELPHVGFGQEPATTSELLAFLKARGISASLGFLYAVYENNAARTQSIYYRGEAELPGDATLLDFDALPWERFRDDATRSMLKRYSVERLQGRYKIYSGDHVSGDVRDVGDAT